jgi:uncharacterized protein (DUF1800 family)
MRIIFRRVAGGLLALALALPPPATAVPARSGPGGDDTRIVHALNRLTWGPRPGDVEAVRRVGLEKWILRQLEPDRISDPGLEQRLASLRSVALDTTALMERYEVPREAKREIQRKRAELGDDPSPEQARALRRELVQKYGGRMQGAPRQVVEELQSAKLLRAVYGERQLDEVLVDFWMNHFNVFANKGPVKFLVGEYEREVIRPHAWGSFEDLLRATAQSPAMLFYLDNWLSADPNAAAGMGLPFRRRTPQMPAGNRRRGLNENYAREIMELHTLGVDGGYTQKDVTEVARCFTGWTIKGLRQQRPEFAFQPRLHDRGDKTVLGRRIKGGGQEEAEQVIHLLATHPSTARFISYKLARRFVSDEPPPALVDRAARVFRHTDGDIREVVKSIVTAPEFFAPEARAAKVKTPLEFVVSAVRAAGAEVTDARALARRLGEMGMPLYLQQPPTGYKDTAESWVSASGLLARLNLALDLTAGRLPGVRFDAQGLAAGGGAPVEAVAARLLPAGLSDATRRTLGVEAAGAEPARLAGLVLGSPDFQRR